MNSYYCYYLNLFLSQAEGVDILTEVPQSSLLLSSLVFLELQAEELTDMMMIVCSDLIWLVLLPLNTHAN